MFWVTMCASPSNSTWFTRPFSPCERVGSASIGSIKCVTQCFTCGTAFKIVFDFYVYLSQLRFLDVRFLDKEFYDEGFF